MKNIRDVSLDGLRGLASVYVIFFHIASSFPEFNQYNIILKYLINTGSSMVYVFFVLSGYFIFYSMESLQAKSRTPVRAFAIRRFLRIMPLWGVLLLVMLLKGEISPQVFLANLFFYFGNFEYSNNQWLPIIHAWTLQAEVAFYFLATFFFRKILKLSAIKILLLWFLNFLIAGFLNFILHEMYGLSDHFLNCFFPSQISYFLAGFFIYKIYHLKDVKQFLDHKQFWIFEFTVLLLFLFKRMEYFRELTPLVLAPLIVFIVLSEQSCLRILLTTKIMKWLGQASFGIYILQDQSRYLASILFPSIQGWPSLILQMVVCVLVGFFAFQCIEKPCILLSKKY